MSRARHVSGFLLVWVGVILLVLSVLEIIGSR